MKPAVIDCQRRAPEPGSIYANTKPMAKMTFPLELCFKSRESHHSCRSEVLCRHLHGRADLRPVLQSLLLRGLVALFVATSCHAGVTYTKSIRYTGGSMLGFVRNLAHNALTQRMLGTDIEDALADQTYTVYVAGSRMAQVAETGSTIFDVDAGTITSIDTGAQTYSVETFADLRARIERAEQWMKHPKDEAVPFRITVERTAAKRSFDGHTATQSVITLTAESANVWGQPVVRVAAWLAPLDSTTRPLYDFSQRAARKLASPFTAVPSLFGAPSPPASATGPGSPPLKGISVLDRISVTGVVNPVANLFHRSEEAATTPVITLEIESSGFRGGPVDDAKFRVPAHFRQEPLHR